MHTASNYKDNNLVSAQGYTWDDIQQHNHEDSCWLVLHGKVYDVTAFVSKHPGGKEHILMCAAKDSATELFESHHPSYVITNKSMLQPYYIGELKCDNSMKQIYASAEQTNFYMTLKQRVENYFKTNQLRPRDNWQIYAKLFLCFALYIGFYFLTFFSHLPLPVTILCALVWGFSIGNLGINIMHDANHGACSFSHKTNSWIAFAFTIFGGSNFVWRHIHTLGHHVNTNVEERDPDIHTNNPHFRRINKSQPFYFWYRFQHIYLPIAYTTLSFEMFIRDFLALFKGGWGGMQFSPMPKGEWIGFFISKAWYLVYNFALPLSVAEEAWKPLLCYTLANMVASVWLVMNFQVNHVTEMAQRFHTDKAGIVHEDWAKIQVMGSTNFASGSWLWNHLSGGLNHQIEHHLFPTISHIHYPMLQPIVQKTCQEFDVPYHSYESFWAAIKSHFALLYSLSSP